MDALEKAELTALNFKIRNTDLQFRSPGHSWQENQKKKTQAIAKRFAFHVNAVIANFIWEETGKITIVSQQWYKLIKMKTWTII